MGLMVVIQRMTLRHVSILSLSKSKHLLDVGNFCWLSRHCDGVLLRTNRIAETGVQDHLKVSLALAIPHPGLTGMSSFSQRPHDPSDSECCSSIETQIVIRQRGVALGCQKLSRGSLFKFDVSHILRTSIPHAKTL